MEEDKKKPRGDQLKMASSSTFYVPVSSPMEVGIKIAFKVNGEAVAGEVQNV